MLPASIQWYYPTRVKEAVALIRKKGIILHGGGTKILEPQPRGSIKGLVDIGGLRLDYIRMTGETVHIGAGATFDEVTRFSRAKKKISMCGESLAHAASTPLRNRITIGGSLCDFPLWSNLYAPLLALDAHIEIVGERPGVYPLEKYASTSLIKSKHLIKEVRVTQKKSLLCGSRAFHVIRFEYPIFNIAAAFAMKGRVVVDARLFITGVKKKFTRLVAAEKVFRGNPLTPETIDDASSLVDVTFVPDYRFSAAYKARVARIYFNDLLNDIRQNRA